MMSKKNLFLKCAIVSAAVGLISSGSVLLSAEAAGKTKSSPNAQIFECKPGPWGRIQWHYLHIEAPDWIVANTLLPHSQPSWSFPGAEPEKVKRFLVSCGIAQELADSWVSDPRAILKGPEATTLFPSPQEIESLKDESRVAVYRELARHQVNEYYANPIYILDRSVDDWLGLRKIRPEIKDVFRRLTYRQGEVLCFSDLSVLMSYAQSDAEARDLAKLGTRRRAIMAYLMVGLDDDIGVQSAYWSAAYRRKDVLPILTSISQLPGGGRIGLSHLMPAQPRKLIYTYPTLDLATTGRLPDCHWTTFNFFSFHPQNIFLDLRLAANRLLEGYDKVSPPYKYGDALVFLNTAGDAIHSCTYLCDDLVFTKNGETVSAPWIIAQLEDVRRLYAHLDFAQIQGFRRRWDQEDR
jgi:hypothetical protein